MEKITKNINEMIPSELAEKVFKITDQASKVLMKYYQQVLDVDYKKDEFDPVTIADKESDNLIREQLHKEFPEDLILSEENNNIPDDYTGRVWMVDPLNGTKSFIKGIDTFAVVIGLVENGVPIFGCVAVPAQNKSFYAEKEKGALKKVNGKFEKISTSVISKIEEARLIVREPIDAPRPIEEKLNKIPFAEKIEGNHARLCMIAEGVAEAHINTNKRASKWDTAAQQIILEEAGGIVTDLDGKMIDYKKETSVLERSFVGSANKKLHEKIIQELVKLEV